MSMSGSEAQIADRVDHALFGGPYGLRQQSHRARLAGARTHGDAAGGIGHGGRVLQPALSAVEAPSIGRSSRAAS
jgi:hypothetical protein